MRYKMLSYDTNVNLMTFSIKKGDIPTYLRKMSIRKYMKNYFRTLYNKFIPDLSRECAKYRVVGIHLPYGYFYSQEYLNRIKQVADMTPYTIFWVAVDFQDYSLDYTGIPKNFIPVFYGEDNYFNKFEHCITDKDDNVSFLCDADKPQNCTICLKCLTQSKVILIHGKKGYNYRPLPQMS